MLKINDIVVFNSVIDSDPNECFDEVNCGIKAKVIHMINDRIDGHIKIVFDLSGFENENKSKWHHMFYDKNHIPCLSYPETKSYKPIISYYFRNDDVESNKYWTVVKENTINLTQDECKALLSAIVDCDHALYEKIKNCAND